jgi:hypothetical protein
MPNSGAAVLVENKGSDKSATQLEKVAFARPWEKLARVRWEEFTSLDFSTLRAADGCRIPQQLWMKKTCAAARTFPPGFSFHS